MTAEQLPEITRWVLRFAGIEVRKRTIAVGRYQVVRLEARPTTGNFGYGAWQPINPYDLRRYYRQADE